MLHLRKQEYDLIDEWLERNDLPAYDDDKDAWLPTLEEMTDYVFPYIEQCEKNMTKNGSENLNRVRNMFAILCWLSESRYLDKGVAREIRKFFNARLVSTFKEVDM